MEIEAKFAVPDPAALEEIAALPEVAGFAISAGTIKNIHDVYLDTADRALFAAGYTCRRREEDARILITVKQSDRAAGAIHRREEFELTLPTDKPPEDWEPGPARDLIRKIAGEKELRPLLELEQTRRTRVIRRGERSIAELSLDEVRLKSGPGPFDFYELEVELLPPGTDPELQAIVYYFQTQRNLRAEPRSKYERALEYLTTTANIGGLLNPGEREVCAKIAIHPNSVGRRARVLLALDAGAATAEVGRQVGLSPRRVKYWLYAFQQKRLEIIPLRWRLEEDPARPAPHPPQKPGLTIEDSMSEAARKTLLFYFKRMMDHEAGTRAGKDIEELHDMRVATRRMRTALQIFADYLDAESLRPFVKMLRRTGRALGAVRDLDVFRLKTQHYLDSLPPSRQDELEPLLAAWQGEYQARRAGMLAHLGSEGCARFKERFGEFLITPGSGALRTTSTGDKPIPYRLRHVLPGVLFAGYAQVRAYDEWLSETNMTLARYHQLRISSKRLRYTLEFFREVLGVKSKPLIEKTKRAQDHLGDLQDAVVACKVLSDFLVWGKWKHKSRDTSSGNMLVAPGAAVYLAVRQAEIRELLQGFPPLWSDLSGTEFGRQLAELAAVI
jgi:CHAD domain-containing protein